MNCRTVPQNQLCGSETENSAERESRRIFGRARITRPVKRSASTSMATRWLPSRFSGVAISIVSPSSRNSTQAWRFFRRRTQGRSRLSSLRSPFFTVEAERPMRSAARSKISGVMPLSFTGRPAANAAGERGLPKRRDRITRLNSSGSCRSCGPEYSTGTCDSAGGVFWSAESMNLSGVGPGHRRATWPEPLADQAAAAALYSKTTAPRKPAKGPDSHGFCGDGEGPSVCDARAPAGWV